MGEPGYRDLLQRLQVALMLALACSVAWFVIKTIHWPLTGDASLMHYAGFLMGHGRAPYREIGDMNFPLSYAPAWVVSHLFGAGDLPWRLYDLVLLVIAGGAMYCIARPHGAFPAVWAGCLFALIHGRDGLLQVGQRDLAAAVLLIVGVAFLFASMRASRSWLAAGFGVCVGLATMIKPTFAAFLLLSIVDYFAQRNDDSNAGKRLRYTVLGWFTPVLGCVAWLAAKGSLGAFWYALVVVGPYHARIGHAPTKFLFSNGVSPIVWLIAAWVIVRLATWWRQGEQYPNGGGRTASLERKLLLLAVVLGYLSYLIQQRGYPYHRYPFQVSLLLVMALDFTDLLRRKAWIRWISVAALVWGAVVLAPVSAAKAGRYEWRQQLFRSAMEADLSRVAEAEGPLDGRVQCLDSISGCVATLDAMRTVQATGLMYDEFLFHAEGTRAVDDARAGFMQQVVGNPPMVFVVSEPLFPAGPDGYKKLGQWPEFRDWFNANYSLNAERSFPCAFTASGRDATVPGYRIYLRK